MATETQLGGPDDGNDKYQREVASEQGELLDLIARHDVLAKELYELYGSVASKPGLIDSAVPSIKIKLDEVVIAFGKAMAALRNGCKDDAEFVHQASEYLMAVEVERTEFLSSIMTETKCAPTHDGNTTALEADILAAMNDDENQLSVQEVVKLVCSQSLVADTNKFIEDRSAYAYRTGELEYGGSTRETADDFQKPTRMQRIGVHLLDTVKIAVGVGLGVATGMVAGQKFRR